MIKPKADYLFEVSWEVCNKVGGIYTVVSSKAGLTKDNYANYFLVGPYFEGKELPEFKPEEPAPELSKAFGELSKEGINCHFGTWLIEGKPSVILIDFSAIAEKKNELKRMLWDEYKIDSINADWDFEEPMCWATAIGMLVEKFSKSNPRKSVVMHCHEWMAGFAILHTKKQSPKVGTVFTTHATMLGRAMCGSGLDLYSMLKDLNPDEYAYKLKVEAKYLTEKACANTSDVFTTVSEITGMEAEKILGRKPDILVLNGLDIGKFPTIEEALAKHRTCRVKIREFLKFYFYPYYFFDVEHNIILFIVGRYEFHNKGIDIFIKALGRLNEMLRKQDTERTISAFFWIPAGNQGIRTEILENKNYYRHIGNYIQYNSEAILTKLTDNIICSSGTVFDKNILSEEIKLELKKDFLHFKRKGLPPLSTHRIDEDNDLIIKAFKDAGLLNKQEDKVKVIFYPVYLGGNDEMINLAYYDAMSGGHLGIFTSYYEPWGYTPLESAALGVPALTSDLAGFGRFIRDKINKEKDKPKGLFILDRLNVSDDDAIKNFTKILYDFSMLEKHQRADEKVAAKELAELCDWKILIENYFKAHNLALEKAGK